MTSSDFQVRQEEDVVQASRLVRVGASSLVAGALGVLLAAWLLGRGAGAVRPSFAAGGRPAPAPSELSGVEQTPIWDTRRGENLREAQRRQLGRWGWVDRDAGVATIPIERAMDLVVQRQR